MRPVTQDMSYEKTRFLNTVFQVIIEYYQGVCKEELCELVEKNELAKAHYRLTQRNQMVAVGCKKPLFISPHSNAGRNRNLHFISYFCF